MTTSPESPVEIYLDAMFDRLAGTGPAGRRLLVEAETHLLQSAAAHRDRGLNEIEAERVAVARFGPVDDLTRQVAMPVGSVRVGARRLLVGGWALASAGLLWYGLSGLVTWLVGWPFARLLIATDRAVPWGPCGYDRTGDACLREVHAFVDAVPWGGARFPYPALAVVGALLMVVLLVCRRFTRLGTPMWTPSRGYAAFAVAVPFSVVGALLVFYGVVDGNVGRLSYVVAGVLALVTAAGALWWRRGAASPTVDGQTSRRPRT